MIPRPLTFVRVCRAVDGRAGFRGGPDLSGSSGTLRETCAVKRTDPWAVIGLLLFKNNMLMPF